MELFIALLTGLTTGGLTCLAVQGGLLASVSSAQASARADPPPGPSATPKRTSRRANHRVQGVKPLAHEPEAGSRDGALLSFLAAKVIAYTVLGALLGASGSLIGTSPATRGWLQLAAGLYMVVTALNLLQVHPIFRYAVLQPPSFVTRRVRRASKQAHLLAPATLGALTVFIPCGTTLAVEFFALSTGDALYGAGIMAAFTLGTSPVFYVLGRAATGFGPERQARFLGFTAAAVLFLGLLSLNTAMNLLDYPLTYAQIEAKVASLPEKIAGRGLEPDQPALSSLPAVSGTLAPIRIPETDSGQSGTSASSTPAASAPTTAAQVLRLDVKSTSYSPNRLTAAAGKPIRIELVTNGTQGCTRAFTIPSLGIQKVLPATGTTVLELPAQKAGTIRFTCSMGMYSGSIVIS